jgi:hypothetical protein
MVRSCVVVLVVASLAACFDSAAVAQDNPVLKELLKQKITEDLARHDAQETAWYSEKSVNKQQWTKESLLIRKVRVASWTEESKTWLWLEQPASTLSIDVKRLEVRDGRVEFSVAAKATARFKAWARIPKLAQAAVGGSVGVAIEIEGSAAIGDGHLQDSKITAFKGVLDGLRFNQKLARPMEGFIASALNDYVEDKNEKLRGSLAKTIDRVHF